jgi:hypothetical protein
MKNEDISARLRPSFSDLSVDWVFSVAVKDSRDFRAHKISMDLIK